MKGDLDGPALVLRSTQPRDTARPKNSCKEMMGAGAGDRLRNRASSASRSSSSCLDHTEGLCSACCRDHSRPLGGASSAYRDSGCKKPARPGMAQAHRVALCTLRAVA